MAAGVALPSTAAKELPINTPCLVSFGRHNVQAPSLSHSWSQMDICPPASHIRRHYDAPWLTGMGDNCGLGAVLPGIENLMAEASRGQEAT
jgi:hypothetical protein